LCPELSNQNITKDKDKNIVCRINSLLSEKPQKSYVSMNSYNENNVHPSLIYRDCSILLAFSTSAPSINRLKNELFSILPHKFAC